MAISKWPRGSALPLHLVVGWKRKYVVRIRVLVLNMILELFFSAPLLWICGLSSGVACQSEIWLGSAKGWVECGPDDANCALIR